MPATENDATKEEPNYRCNHGTDENVLCRKCERNEECNWNDGADYCYCEVAS